MNFSTSRPDNFVSFMSEAEMLRIQQYFINYFGENEIPNGTKLTRVKYGYRFVYICSEQGQYTPSELPLLNDEIGINSDTTHSAIFLNGRFIYLQNKNDSLLEEAKSMDIDASFDETESERTLELSLSASTDSLVFGDKSVRDHHIIPHHYLANGSQGQAKVKYATDDEGRRYIYKTFKLKIEGQEYLPEYEDVSQFDPVLFFACYAREEVRKDGNLSYERAGDIVAAARSLKEEDDDIASLSETVRIVTERRKQIEVQYYAGETLFDFLERREKSGSISKVEKDAIIYAILSEIQKTHERSIVHGDVKLENICIQGTLETGFKIKFIDWGSAYFKARPTTGYGTVGYVPPEFFQKVPESFDSIESVLNYSREQEESHSNHPSNAALTEKEKEQKYQEYIARFKSPADRVPYLTEKMDVFALGVLFLRHFKLTRDSFFYPLVERMVHANPARRPALAEINIELERFDNQRVIEKITPISSSQFQIESTLLKLIHAKQANYGTFFSEKSYRSKRFSTFPTLDRGNSSTNSTILGIL